MSLARITPTDLAQRGISDEDVLATCAQIDQHIRSLEDVNQIANAAAVVGAYRHILRQRGGSVWSANRAMVSVVRIEQHLGRQLGDHERRGKGSRSSKNELLAGGGADPLPDGISRALSHRAKLLKTWGTSELETFVASYEALPQTPEAPKDLLARSRIYSAAKAELKRRRRAAEAKRVQLEIAIPEDLPVLHGSFVDVAKTLADASVDFIFTDPPYHDRHIPLYDDLGQVAARVLKDGASLITYTSHHKMPEVIQRLQAAGLTFFWPLAMVHTGQLARMTEYGIVVHWKPLLWFVKGRFRRRGEHMTFVNDLIESKREKDAHDWQQGVVEAEYYIRLLTKPGEFVFDPFCGGGTTAVAAAKLQRRWLTCDIDEETVWIARGRIVEATAS